MDDQQIFDSWAINNRINLYLLGAIPAEHLGDVLASKGREVGKQFAHIHNVRLMWLKSALPVELERSTKIDTEQPIDKTMLISALTESGESVGRLLEDAAENGGKVKGFKPHLTAFVGYLTSHEAHHRSQAIIALKQSGHQLDKKVLYGIWEWGSR